MAKVEQAALPFTILSGFLGAGKTSMLNRVLAAAEGKRITVMVNELGRISVDDRLIQNRGGDVLELSGGCVCCTIDVNKDLWQGIVEIIDNTKPEQVILETTGIAEPELIVAGLKEMPEPYRDRVFSAGIITVVDALAGPAQIARHPEAAEQVISADRILLSKLDLATGPEVLAAHTAVRGLNPFAERCAFPAGSDRDRMLVEWLLAVRRSSAANRKSAHTHQHQLAACSIACETPLAKEPLMQLMEELGSRLVRAKGFVWFQGDEFASELQFAGGRWESRPISTHLHQVLSTGMSELVFIGERLDESALRRQVWACGVGAKNGEFPQ